jgi:hypothetical protein
MPLKKGRKKKRENHGLRLKTWGRGSTYTTIMSSEGRVQLKVVKVKRIDEADRLWKETLCSEPECVGEGFGRSTASDAAGGHDVELEEVDERILDRGKEVLYGVAKRWLVYK